MKRFWNKIKKFPVYVYDKPYKVTITEKCENYIASHYYIVKFYKNKQPFPIAKYNIDWSIGNYNLKNYKSAVQKAIKLFEIDLKNQDIKNRNYIDFIEWDGK